MSDYAQDEPARQDSTLIIGNTWRLDLAVQDEDGVAFDLTGVTGTASIVVEARGAVRATPTVTVTDAAAGEVSVELAAADSATLVRAEPLLYAVQLTWPDGSVWDVLEGRLTVRSSLVP